MHKNRTIKTIRDAASFEKAPENATCVRLVALKQ